MRPCTTGHPPASGVAPSATIGSWLSDIAILPEWADTCSGTAVGTGGAQAPVDDLGLADRVAVVVGSGQAGRLADRAVDVGEDAARPAHDMVVVVPDPPLVPGRAAGRLQAAYQSRRGECVQGVIHGLKGDMPDAVAHPGGDRLRSEER